MKTKEKIIQKEIQSFMKDRRIALGIKQSEIEKISGMKTRMLQKFEQTGEITLKNLIKLFIAYKMDNHVIPALTDRKWWAIEEIERAENQKTVRSSKPKTTGIWIIPKEGIKAANLTPFKKYQALFGAEGWKEKKTESGGRSFLISDDNGKEYLIEDINCERIIEK